MVSIILPNGFRSIWEYWKVAVTFVPFPNSDSIRNIPPASRAAWAISERPKPTLLEVRVVKKGSIALSLTFSSIPIPSSMISITNRSSLSSSLIKTSILFAFAAMAFSTMSSMWRERSSNPASQWNFTPLEMMPRWSLYRGLLLQHLSSLLTMKGLFHFL